MRVLVTGATGKIGTKVIAELRKRGERVRALVRTRSDRPDWSGNVEIEEGDLHDGASLMRATAVVDAVIHCAGITHTHHPHEYFAVNTEGTRRLLAACAHNRVARFILVSSRTASAEGGSYAYSKLLAEQMVKGYPYDWLILQLAEVYGGGAQEAIAQIIRAVRHWPFIPVIGDRNAEVSPLYIDDAVQGIVAALTAVHTRTSYVLAGPEEFSFNALVRRIMACVGTRKPVLHLPVWTLYGIAALARVFGWRGIVRDQIPRLLCAKPSDISSARREFGFAPRPLEEGLSNFL